MLIDIVNNKNQPIGTSERSLLLPNGKNFRTVHAWLIGENGKVILQRLVNGHSRSPNKLGSSIAAYLEAGETNDEALARKAKLEVGASPQQLRLIDTVAMADVNSMKFVSLYIGKFQSMPTSKDQNISDFLMLTPAELDARVQKSRSDFTKTFLFLYDNCRDSIQL